MAKSKEKIKARKLRKKGLSMKEIANKLGVSKGTVSLWCGDIKLTKKQAEKLHSKMVHGSCVGRMIGVEMQKERKRKKIEEYLTEARKEIASMTRKEFLIMGLGLYWGEGGKSNSRVGFYNSDSLIIKFIMKWFRDILGITDDRFAMYITINKNHKNRLDDVKKYWSEITNIPLSQFRKPILIKSKNKKIYENHFQHYGTLCVRITKSSDLFYRIMGLIKALGENI